MFKNKFFAVVAATIIIYSCSEDNETIESFSVATSIQKDTTFSKLYINEIQAVKKVEIRSRIKGFIDKIHIDEGSYVKEGLNQSATQ
jgi:hypothetical protein